MEKLSEHIVDSFNKNQDNFMREIRRIIYENEYVLNERSQISINGFFDEVDICPYLQFDFETDNAIFATAFYKYNFSRKNQITKDETDIPDGVEIAKAVQILYSDDIESE